MIQNLKLHIPVVLAALLCVACAKTEIPVVHRILPEADQAGTRGEKQCLRSYQYYTLETRNAVLFGMTGKIKNRPRSKSTKAEALPPDALIPFSVNQMVTDSTNYQHATREALMYGYGYPREDSNIFMLYANSGFHRYDAHFHKFDTLIRHADILRFKHFALNTAGRTNSGDATIDPPPNQIVPHVTALDWHGKHFCPLRINQNGLFLIQDPGDSLHYAVIYGKIMTMNGLHPSDTIVLKIKNEVTDSTNEKKLPVEEIIATGAGFPEHFVATTKVIRHDQIKEFRLVKNQKSKMRPPDEPAGKRASWPVIIAVNAFVYGALISAIID